MFILNKENTFCEELKTIEKVSKYPVPLWEQYVAGYVAELKDSDRIHFLRINGTEIQFSSELERDVLFNNIITAIEEGKYLFRLP